MRKLIVPVVAMMLVFGVFGCAKEPVEEINASKAAVESLTQAGGEAYAAEELAVLRSDMTAAMDEIAAQNDNFLKNYDQAKQMLVKVAADSEQIKATIAGRKEEVKQKAIVAEQAAQAAIAEATNLLSVAPQGKGSSAEIEAMGADLQGLTASLPEVQTLIASEDFAGALAKADAISQNAGKISEEIKLAMEKIAQAQAEKDRIAQEQAAAKKAAKSKKTSKK